MNTAGRCDQRFSSPCTFRVTPVMANRRSIQARHAVPGDLLAVPVEEPHGDAAQHGRQHRPVAGQAPHDRLGARTSAAVEPQQSTTRSRSAAAASTLPGFVGWAVPTSDSSGAASSTLAYA